MQSRRGQPIPQRNDRGVPAIDVVADPGLEHRRAHRAGGLGHRVAAHVDHVHGSRREADGKGLVIHCR